MNPIALRLLRAAAKESNPDKKRTLTTRAGRINLRDAVSSCHACPLRELSGVDEPFTFRGPSPAILAIIIDQPTRRDIAPNTRPAQRVASPSTPHGRVLDRLLDGIGLLREHVWVDVANRCPTKTAVGVNLLSPANLTKHGVDKDDLSPRTCVDRFAEKSLRLSGADVVLCMGASALMVAKRHKAFKESATFAVCASAQPVLQAGRFWIVTHSLEDVARDSTKLAEAVTVMRAVSELIQDQIERRAMMEFPGSTVVGSRSYAEVCAEVLGECEAALCDLPPSRARLAVLDALEGVVRVLESSGTHTHRINARYALRLLRSAEAGRVVWPRLGFIAEAGGGDGG